MTLPLTTRILGNTLIMAALCFVGNLEAAGSKADAWWEQHHNQEQDSLTSILGGVAEEWKITGTYRMERDASLDAEVMTATNGVLVLERPMSSTGDREIRARVRLRTDIASSVSATFTASKKDANNPGMSVSLSTSKDADCIRCEPMLGGKLFHDLDALTAKLDWSASPCSHNGFDYYPRAYPRILPGWERAFRQQTEIAMASLPDKEQKWIDLRVELRKGFIRVWMEDRLVAYKTDPSFDPEGSLRIQLSPGVQLAFYSVTPLAPSPDDFLPIPLGGYHNARALLKGASVAPDSLPPAGQSVSVHGIPFVFSGVNSEGNDHIDVGQSFFRESNAVGYYPAGYPPGARFGIWNGAQQRDPARIQLRIPNGQYDSLYVIAASEEKRNTVPILSATFYRPGAGFNETFETRVPLAATSRADAIPLSVILSDDRKANLWLVKIPLDPGKLSSFGDLDVIEVELTKKVYPYRNYPDPINCGWHQGGPPSAVHVFAVTLGQAPVGFSWEPDVFGHVWTSPEVPSYTATVVNHTDTDQHGKLTVTTRSYDGTELSNQEFPIQLTKGQSTPIKVSLPVKLNGYHDVTATLDMAGKQWTEKRSMVRLTPDTRPTKWTEGKGALFGFYSLENHYTPKLEHHVRLMTLAGARTSVAIHDAHKDMDLVKKHWSPAPGNCWPVVYQPWAGDEKKDPAKVAEFHKAMLQQLDDTEKHLPPELKPDHLVFFPEPYISTRLSYGNFPDYWNGDPFVYTDEEKERLKGFMETARLAAEKFRTAFPGRKIFIPHGDPMFVVPLLRAGFPTNLVDGSGIDRAGFERMPEMQLKDNAPSHRLYVLRKEFEKVGIKQPRLYAIEGIFVPTLPGSCTWREQMDHYTRWSLLDMGYGVDRSYGGWCTFDVCGSYGAEHYGGGGIQRRIPYCDPKPAYAAYATLTDKLNEANFDGWLKTGSLTTYCMRFKHVTRGNIYALWTVRGKRPVTLTLNVDSKVGITDCMNNTKEVASQDKKITVMTDPSVIYVTQAGEVTSVTVENPDHSDVAPAQDAKLVADLGDGSWKYTSRRDEVYEKNHFGFDPAPGKFSAAVDADPVHGKVLVSKLENQDKVRELMPWYNTLKPSRPIELEGAPSHIGLWVKGASDWGRVIYILRDNKGERWISIGTKDDFNCDDIHSWSSFNFDGWRYLRFELPGHMGWDNYRKIGTTWWGSSAKAACSPNGKPNGDNIVDLPLSLEELIIEQRTHILYVNNIQPVASNAVSFGKIYAEYETPEDATSEAVKLSRLRMSAPKNLNLPNPIERMAREGVGAPTKITKLVPPEHFYDGTRMHVHFTEVPGARKYCLWVAPYEDGRSAVNMVPAGIKSGDLVTDLCPDVKLYYWITYEDAQGKMSKPSPTHMEITVDNFSLK